MTVWYPTPRDEAVFRNLALALEGVADLTREKPGQCDMLIEGRPSREQLQVVRGGGSVIVPFAGVPTATIALMRNRPDVSLQNLHHNAADTAETAMALLLAASRAIVRGDGFLRRGDWEPRYTPEECIRLAGKRVAVVGMGQIGRRIASCCRALEMDVAGIRRQGMASPIDGIPVHPVEELHHRLAKAHVVILALPQTSETEGLIGRELLERLLRPAFLVNIARAQIVEELALYEALRDGVLHAAGLDVWYRYPKHPEGIVPGYFEMPDEARHTFPSEFPFHELPNVVMSPHRAGSSADSETLRVEHLSGVIRHFADGDQVTHRVDLDRGY